MEKQQWGWRVFSVFLLLVFLAGSLVALAVAVDRWRSEARSRTVELVMDYPSLYELSLVSGVPVAQAVRAVASAGVNALAIGEQTVADYVADGVLQAVSGQDLAGWQALSGRLPPAWQELRWNHIYPDYTYVRVAPGAPQGAANQAWEALRLRTQILGAQTLGPGRDTGRVLAIPLNLDTVLALGLGVNQRQLALARSAGLAVVLRTANVPGLTPELLRQWLATWPTGAQSRRDRVIFAGGEALGYPNLLEPMAKALRERGWPLVTVEFSAQKGMNGLAKRLGYQVVRAHSVPPAQQAEMSPPALLDRYLLAVRERGIRLLYLRPVAMAGILPGSAAPPGLPSSAPGGMVGTSTEGSLPDQTGTAVAGMDDMPAAPQGQGSAPETGRQLWEDNLHFLGRLRESLAREGFTTGIAQPLPALVTPRWAPASIMLMAGAVMAAAIWLLTRMFGYSAPGGWALLWVLGELGALALYLKGYTVLDRQLWALGAALVFPASAWWYAFMRLSGGVAWLSAPSETPADQAGRQQAGPAAEPVPPAAGEWKAWLWAVGRMWLAAALALVGCLFIVGLLGETRFMVQIYPFAGVKVAHLLPLLLAVLLAGWRISRPLPVPPWSLRSLGATVRRWGKSSLKYWHLAVGLVALVVVYVYLTRTGNDAPVPVTGLEQAMRSGLTNLLAIRPRTKEFLIGYPAFLLAAYALASPRVRGWAAGAPPWCQTALRLLWLAAASGALIPLVSLNNTFSHIHTPLEISLWRTFNGLWLGTVIASLVVALLGLVLRVWHPHPQAPQR